MVTGIDGNTASMIAQHTAVASTETVPATTLVEKTLVEKTPVQLAKEILTGKTESAVSNLWAEKAGSRFGIIAALLYFLVAGLALPFFKTDLSVARKFDAEVQLNASNLDKALTNAVTAAFNKVKVKFVPSSKEAALAERIKGQNRAEAYTKSIEDLIEAFNKTGNGRTPVDAQAFVSAAIELLQEKSKSVEIKVEGQKSSLSKFAEQEKLLIGNVLFGLSQSEIKSFAEEISVEELTQESLNGEIAKLTAMFPNNTATLAQDLTRALRARKDIETACTELLNPETITAAVDAQLAVISEEKTQANTRLAALRGPNGFNGLTHTAWEKLVSSKEDLTSKTQALDAARTSLRAVSINVVGDTDDALASFDIADQTPAFINAKAAFITARSAAKAAEEVVIADQTAFNNLCSEDRAICTKLQELAQSTSENVRIKVSAELTARSEFLQQFVVRA